METEAGSSPASLSWLEVWRLSLLRPTAETFHRISGDPKANIKWGLFWAAVASLILWFFGPQRAVWSGVVINNFGFQAADYFLWLGAVAASIISAFGLLVDAAILHALARLFGGAGAYPRLVYCWGVILPPFVLLSVLVGRFPSLFPSSREFIFSPAYRVILGASLLLFIIVYLYLFYVQVVALSAVERMGFWKGFGVLLLLAVLAAILGACLSNVLPGLLMDFAP